MKLPQALPGIKDRDLLIKAKGGWDRVGVAWALTLGGGRLQGWLAVQGGAGSQLEPPGLLGKEAGTHNYTQSWVGTAPPLPAKPSAGTSVEICLAGSRQPV